MSKKWKIKVADWFLRRYTAKYGRFQDKATFDGAQQFDNIVIYSTTALGDFMFNTPALRAMRERYPNAHITLVVHKKNRELVENGRYYDRVVYWDSKIKTIRPLLKSLREHQPDLALILHSHLPYDIISAVLAGAKYIIRDNYSSGICGLEPWLTNYVFHYYGHFVRRKLELISILGCRSDDPTMEIPVDYQRGVKSSEHPTIGFQLGASTESRCWPVSHYARLADELVAKHPNVRIVLIGAPFDDGGEHRGRGGCRVADSNLRRAGRERKLFRAGAAGRSGAAGSVDGAGCGAGWGLRHCGGTRACLGAGWAFLFLGDCWSRDCDTQFISLMNPAFLCNHSLDFP